MNNEKITDRLGKMVQKLNGIAGRMIVTAMSGNQDIKEAHQMALELSCEMDDFINDILESGELNGEVDQSRNG